MQTSEYDMHWSKEEIIVMDILFGLSDRQEKRTKKTVAVSTNYKTVWNK